MRYVTQVKNEHFLGRNGNAPNNRFNGYSRTGS
jgi:hypothetical protein